MNPRVPDESTVSRDDQCAHVVAPPLSARTVHVHPPGQAPPGQAPARALGWRPPDARVRSSRSALEKWKTTCTKGKATNKIELEHCMLYEVET